MSNINKHITLVERMLDLDEVSKPRRFTSFEAEAIKLLLNIAKTIDTLLYVMDRPISSDDRE